MTEEQFLSALRESRLHIDWYIDSRDAIRGILLRDKKLVCPITGVAWYLGYPLRDIDEVFKSADDLGLSNELSNEIADAADPSWIPPSVRSRMRLLLLKATGLYKREDGSNER